MIINEGVAQVEPVARRIRRRVAPGRHAGRRIERRSVRLTLQLAALAAVLGLWQLLVSVGALDPLITSSPIAVVRALVTYVSTAQGRAGIAITASETWWGLVIATVIGIPAGFAMGLSRVLETLAMPFVTFFVAAPRIAFIPIFVIWLGIGSGSKIALAALMATMPIIINTRAAVTFTDRDLLRVCRAFGGSRWQSFAKIVLPNAVPGIVAGLRLGIGFALVGVVVGEFYAATGGVGYDMAQAGSLFQTNTVMGLVVLAGLAGVAASALLGQLERYLSRWRPRDEVART